MKWLRAIGLSLLLLGVYHSAVSAETVDSVKPPSSVKDVVAKFSEPKEIAANELVVKFKEGISEQRREALLRLFRAAELSFMDIGNFSLVKAPKVTDLKGLAAKLVQLPEIESVEPNYVIERTYTPSDPGYSKQWHLKKINAPKAWDTTKGSGQITVAVVDDGVQMNHPDLAGKIVSPYNVLTGAKSVPAGEHGTHVAGIIAASINKKGVVGVAPNVKIMPVNVFEGDGATSYDVAYGIVYAVDHGANVINLSLGSYSATVYEAEAVQYAVSKGAVLVAAAGNDDIDFPVYPAAFDPVIAVSATDSSDWITDFSNYGDYIDLAAPGVNIYSTFPGSSYYSLTGTSMAAPIVSGTAALVLSKNPLLTRGEVESILRKSTVDLGGKGWDVFYGYGRVDAYKAVRNTPSPLSSISAAGTFTMKGNNKVGFSLSAYRKGLKVTAYVKNSRGYAVRTIAKNKLWNSNRISLSWDGKQDNGAFVGSGAYTMVVQVSNGRETVAKTKQIKVVDSVVPSIQLSSSTVSFSPKAKGKVSIPFALNKKASVTAQVYDSKNKLVKTIWSNKWLSGGKQTLVWDGKNASGKLLPDGTYRLKLSAVDDKKRKAAARSLSVVIDTKVAFSGVSLGQTLFKMDGVAKASFRMNLKEPLVVSAYVKTEKGAISKQLLRNKKYNSGSYTISWDGKDNKNAFVSEGNYYYTVEIADLCGNKLVVHTAKFKVEDWRKPTIQAPADLYYVQQGPFDIPYTLSKAGSVTVEIYQDSSLVRTVLSGSQQGPGSKKAAWDGKDGSGQYVADGQYEVRMKVVDARGQQASFTSLLHVDLTNVAAPQVVWFYEEMGSEVHFRLSTPATVTAEIFNEAGEKVRTIWTEHPLNAGDQVLTWDGLNDNGETVFYDDSVYTFRIAARFANGVIETAEGKIDNSADPPWLVSSLYSFTYDSYGNRTALNLSIRVTEAVTATLFVYDPYGDAYIDEKTYSLKANVETNIVYAKKDKYSDYYYLLAYKDRLGNVYVYGVDETEETGYAASYRLQKENGAKNGLKRSVN
ncbi:S8 family serine peptidase [Geobacillus stearothermophilus]|uniref:S8 family serine peptidase n=1 Tax=Geobacillus stearothermophilus TaxID=1422 RepID=UPI003D22F456